MTAISRRGFIGGLAGAAVSPRDRGRKGEHHVYDLHGSPFQVGRAHGEALSAEIRKEAGAAVESLARRLALPPEAALERFRSRYEGLFREHLPLALEEIRGLAEGARLSYAYAFFAATRDQARAPAEGCTAFYAGGPATAGNRVLLGQTKDTSAPLSRYRILRIAYDSGRSMVLLNYPGWIGNIGLTSAAMSFSGNSLYASAPPGPTVPGSLLKRLVLERSSVPELLSEIRGMSFENGCYLVADRAGAAVCLECVAGRVEAIPIDRRAYGHTNDILSASLRPLEGKSGSASSPLRQKNIHRLLSRASGAITAGRMEKILRDHTDFPLSICRHPSPLDPDTTTAAFIADLTAQEIRIAIGNPCTAPFVRYLVPKARTP